tara:strand:- start:42045 stop:42230 length:186 start_codon:yes stop_codon:yes gene_type:complete
MFQGVFLRKAFVFIAMKRRQLISVEVGAGNYILCVFCVITTGFGEDIATMSLIRCCQLPMC